MPPYRSIGLLGDWLKLTFTENPGMAFGITFGPVGLITGFSIVATMLIIVYMYRVRKGYTPYRASLALILGGAVGNIIDRLFYGMFFGYGEFFRGRVVDFIHINIWNGLVPEGVPLIGGTYMALFPIFNVADMAIVIGVVGILVFQKKFHLQLMETTETDYAVDDGYAALPVDRSAGRLAQADVHRKPRDGLRHYLRPGGADHGLFYRRDDADHRLYVSGAQGLYAVPGQPGAHPRRGRRQHHRPSFLRDVLRLRRVF